MLYRLSDLWLVLCLLFLNTDDVWKLFRSVKFSEEGSNLKTKEQSAYNLQSDKCTSLLTFGVLSKYMYNIIVFSYSSTIQAMLFPDDY